MEERGKDEGRSKMERRREEGRAEGMGRRRIYKTWREGWERKKGRDGMMREGRGR